MEENQVRKICYWLWIILAGSCLVACDSATHTNGSHTAISHPIPIFPPQGLPSNYVYDPRWSTDSQILFFSVDSDLWAYDFSTEKTGALDSNNPWNQADSEQTARPLATPDTQSNIPDGFHIMAMSPSGRKALVSRSSIASAPVVGDDPSFIDVWIWEEGELRSPGTIEICGPNQYIWAEDEKFVGIQAPLAPARCNQSSGWLVDMSKNEVFPVLPVEIYHANSLLHSFSPESDHLLIRYGYSDERGPASGLQILDLETHEVSQLTTPFNTDPVDWISNNKLLVLYKDQLVAEVRKLAILDLKNDQIVDLIAPEHLTTLNGQYILEAALSPGKKWIAFTLEDQRYETSSLWITRLDPE